MPALLPVVYAVLGLVPPTPHVAAYEVDPEILLGALLSGRNSQFCEISEDLEGV